jgi:hypothetical protein
MYAAQVVKYARWGVSALRTVRSSHCVVSVSPEQLVAGQSSMGPAGHSGYVQGGTVTVTCAGVPGSSRRKCNRSHVTQTYCGNVQDVAG